MNITKASLSNPTAVAVGVIMLLLLGLISLNRLPVQLTPEVEYPEITIKTTWRAAAPEEVESEIVEPQEKVLRGMPGMRQMLSTVRRGIGEITVKFAVGTNLERGLLEVLNRLNRVASYPEDADEPVISAVGGESRPIAWFIISKLDGNERDIDSYQDFMEEVVQTRFERVPGVARSEIVGGRAREVRITFDPYKAASLGIELPKVIELAGSGRDITAGFNDVGKRRYTVRFEGSWGADELGELIIEWRDGHPVLLRDVADVDVTLVDRDSFVIAQGIRVMAANAHREIGVNVLEVMAGLREAVAELEAPLASAGLKLEQVYDDTVYINRSISMLRTNLGIGVLLAVGVLWWFLRRFRATLVVAAAIPLSVVAAFIVLDASGRTLNVISLAGLALAVGMVLDAAIIVLENIVRLKEHGEDAETASVKGPDQVWGALLASTATTVAIFLPVVFLQDEAGQLFVELAISVAVAVTASLIVAVTVIPTAARKWLHAERADPHDRIWDRVTAGIMHLTSTPRRRMAWIAGLIVVPLLVNVLIMPKANYLPTGNRNLVIAFILPPPGTNIDTIERELGSVIAQRIEPWVSGEKEPKISQYFFVAFPFGVFMGARAEDPSRISELIPVVNQVIQGFPATIAIAMPYGLFGNLGEGNNIEVNVQSQDLESALAAGLAGYGLIAQAIPGAQIRPLPGLELAEPQLRLVPDERRLREVGWHRGQLAGVVRALGDGLYAGDYFDGENRLDIIVRGQNWDTPEELGAMPLATPAGGVVPLSELVAISRTAGPNEIRRLDRRRTVTLRVTPPDGMSLEEGLQRIRTEVEPALLDLLPEDGSIRYSGAADKLKAALSAMGGSFILAIAILYLLMSALFRSFRDSLMVLLILPLATVGGVIALNIVNLVTFQPMDLLTMIGFVILLGLVVNNAILLVHQSRAAERRGLARESAVEEAVRLRLRPILMSTLTSLFGMLPLLLIPGAGTELYRGLAAVIVGGMTVSTVFTLLLLPSLLRLGEEQNNAV